MNEPIVFYDGGKEVVQKCDLYIQDDGHTQWARGEWVVLDIDRFTDGLNFPRVTRRNITTGQVDINGWNSRGKHLIHRAKST